MIPSPGYEIVCPDGRVRCYPYHNVGDARCDAEVLTTRGCVKDPLGNQPTCPSGEHTVRTIMVAYPESSGPGEA